MRDVIGTRGKDLRARAGRAGPAFPRFLLRMTRDVFVGDAMFRELSKKNALLGGNYCSLRNSIRERVPVSRGEEIA